MSHYKKKYKILKNYKKITKIFHKKTPDRKKIVQQKVIKTTKKIYSEHTNVFWVFCFEGCF